MKGKTLKQTVDGLNAYLAAHPEYADLPALTAGDDEGNWFNQVYYDPTYDAEWELRNGDTTEGICLT